MTTRKRRAQPRARRPGLDDYRYRTAREELKRRGSHVCHWCRHLIDTQIKYPHPLSWSADHKIPRSQLAPEDPRNWELSALLECHLRCNQSRGAKPLKPIPGLGEDKTSIEW